MTDDRTSAIEHFLSFYPVPVAQTALQLMALVRATVPGVHEALYPGWKLIGYRAPVGKKSRYFCYVAPLAGEVRLGFERGVDLSDPEGLLLGNGTQVRYLAATPDQPWDPARFAALIAQAAARLHR